MQSRDSSGFGNMSLKDSAELKGLENRITKMMSEQKELDVEIDGLQKRRSNLNSEIKRINQMILLMKDKKKKDIIVSEHAILRYLERVHEINMDSVREDILPDVTKGLIEKMGGANGKYPAKTHQVILKDNTVVTIEPEKE